MSALLNAIQAVERDPVRRHERLLDIRLAAAVFLAPRVEVAEALLAGVPVPWARIDPHWTYLLRLPVADVVLDERLALRVIAHGPTKEKR